jgi:hypothetical protein
MRKSRAIDVSRVGKRALRRLALPLAVMAMLAACSDAPIGVAPNFHGTLWEHALMTNPNGGGPQVVRWGPPDARSLGRD